jgi:hypothetical protein
MTNPEIFRPWSGYLMAGVVFLMSAILSIQIATQGDLHGTLTAIAWGTAACCLAYLIFIRPKVTLFDEGLTITNPFIEITLGWQAVEEIEARYCMSVSVGERQIYAWAAPAPGRYHARTVHESEIKGLKVGASNVIRPGESPRTHSGIATHLAKLRLEKFRDSPGVQRCKSEVGYNTAGVVVLVTSLCIGLLLNFSHF